MEEARNSDTNSWGSLWVASTCGAGDKEKKCRSLTR